MPYRPFAGQNCSVAGALAVVGERWTLLVMREVLLGRRRFEDIRRNTGAATNILSDRLQTLVAQGLLAHTDASGYVATEKGLDIQPVLTALMLWGDKHAAPAGAPLVAVHTACGHDAHPAQTCAHCGEPLRPGQVAMRPGPGATDEQRTEGVLPRV